MPFEFDPAKSEANKRKHGIDFEEAQALWNDPRVLHVAARSLHETRLLAVGLIGGRHWAAFWTRRGENVRLISVRRARKEEIRLYEQAQNHNGGGTRSTIR